MTVEPVDAERRELERAIELLGRNSRPGRLLKFLGEKYFQKQEGQLTEFHIATGFFGRSAKQFDAGLDAVVRVETHRLRKKLRELYEKHGSEHGLQISLPSGYLLHFSPAPVPVLEPVFDHEPEPAAHPREPAATPPQKPAPFGLRKWALHFTAVAIVAAAIVIASMSNGTTKTPTAVPFEPERHLASAPMAEGSGVQEIHVMAGYTGSDVIDNSGVRWTPDRFFTGGGTWPSDSSFARRTSRPFLFLNWRNGEFNYDIPMQPGVYELRLLFVSPMRPGSEKLAGFNVSLGGKPLLTAFDVNIDAHGADIADERVFRDVVPGDDGFIHLAFSNQIDKPWLNALEIVPGIPGKQRPVRIITQPTSFVDHKGQRWRADDYFLNGIQSIERRKVSGTEDPELFAAERYGHFSYSIPVDTRGRYTVVLHFAEFYFGSEYRGGGGGVGSRIFHVFCNGQALLRNFDVYEEGGSLHVVTKTFADIEPSAQGKINLTFEPVVNNATISGIEILDQSD